MKIIFFFSERISHGLHFAFLIHSFIHFIHKTYNVQMNCHFVARKRDQNIFNGIKLFSHLILSFRPWKFIGFINLIRQNEMYVILLRLAFAPVSVSMSRANVILIVFVYFSTLNQNVFVSFLFSFFLNRVSTCFMVMDENNIFDWLQYFITLIYFVFRLILRYLSN